MLNGIVLPTHQFLSGLLVSEVVSYFDSMEEIWLSFSKAISLPLVKFSFEKSLSLLLHFWQWASFLMHIACWVVSCGFPPFWFVWRISSHQFCFFWITHGVSMFVHPEGCYVCVQTAGCSVLCVDTIMLRGSWWEFITWHLLRIRHNNSEHIGRMVVLCAEAGVGSDNNKQQMLVLY